MKIINFKALSKRKKITLIALSVLFIASIIAVFLSKHEPQTKTPTFSSFLKHSATSGIIHSPFSAAPVPAETGKIKIAAPKSVISKKQDNKLNDLFKLEQKKKSLPISTHTAHPYPMPATFPAGQGYPNINNIPNAIKNIRSQLPGITHVPNRQKFEVLGISGRNAVIQYKGADLYLKSNEAFGSCFVIEIGYSSVKISCNKIARSYPVSFGANTNNNGNTNLNPVRVPKVK
ncbi:MAG: hypothetical protein M1467_04485 [Deltaproteobacteria bacterium]|nr:hypothetical protein [Deltaproteobacteria bacterium]MCL5880363.1 hypothetical protein [Deltaproteobacteria bacterium]